MRMDGGNFFSTDEDRLWRALIRATTLLPRALDEELERGSRVSLSEFGVLLHLSEADGNQMRMAEIATTTGLSASRITRVVAEMQSRGWVVKSPSADDGRGNVTKLTTDGHRQLREAYPVQVAGARRILFDRLTVGDISAIGQVLEEMVATLRGDDVSQLSTDVGA
jgi:DNA-binding MarR family transcriptional regulator